MLLIWLYAFLFCLNFKKSVFDAPFFLFVL